MRSKVCFSCTGVSQQAQHLDPMLGYCWPTVSDVGTTLTQHRVKVSCLLGWYCYTNSYKCYVFNFQYAVLIVFVILVEIAAIVLIILYRDEVSMTSYASPV